MEENANGVRKSLALLFQATGFDYFEIDHLVSKGIGWYFPLPEWEEELIMGVGEGRDLHASVPFRGSALIGPAGF